MQAGREVRIMVKPDVISDDQVILLARSIAKKIEDTLTTPPRSRSTSSARAALWNTQNKDLGSEGRCTIGCSGPFCCGKHLRSGCKKGIMEKNSSKGETTA